ncbi:MAG: hypothetical protein HC906_07140 [Bacteroidales bacterium]|nr:hypothetical protein [Bacteroidales bacterium]
MKIEEDELLKKFRIGDRKAFEIIFNNYFEKLCLYSNEFVKDEGNAEEIVEDFFFNLWINHENLEINSLKPYLFRSIHNRSINYLKKEQ